MSTGEEDRALNAFREQRKDDGRALGQRLRSARTIAGETLESVAQKLTAGGIKVGKAAVGHWETGHAVPDALQIRRLAKMYGTTTDALLWDDSISIEAIRFAAQFDALTDKQQRTFRAMWLAYFEQAKSDEEVGEKLGLPPKADAPAAATPLPHRPPAPSRYVATDKPGTGAHERRQKAAHHKK